MKNPGHFWMEINTLLACDCAARTERKTNSTSPQQRRTSANSQSWSLLRQKWRDADARKSLTENWRDIRVEFFNTIKPFAVVPRAPDFLPVAHLLVSRAS